MKSAALLLSALVLAGACTGISDERDYLDPAIHPTRYEDLSRPEQPLRLRITVAQTYDGRPYPFDEKGRMRARVVRVLQDSGLVRSSYAGEDGSIDITFNDAPAKSLRDGGGPGWHAREVYELTIVISTDGRTATRNYEHALLRYRGEAREVAGLKEPVSAGEAVDTIVEQMLLRALVELQREGVIPAGNRT